MIKHTDVPFPLLLYHNIVSTKCMLGCSILLFYWYFWYILLVKLFCACPVLTSMGADSYSKSLKQLQLKKRIWYMMKSCLMHFHWWPMYLGIMWSRRYLGSYLQLDIKCLFTDIFIICLLNDPDYLFLSQFFEHGSAAQRRELADQLNGRVLTLSLQMYGCRVIQKVFFPPFFLSKMTHLVFVNMKSLCLIISACGLSVWASYISVMMIVSNVICS